MCGKTDRKIEFNSEDYLMMLASTGQPSFYPQAFLDEKDKKEEKKEDKKEGEKEDTAFKSDEDENEDDNNEKGVKIFNFH